MCYVSIGFFIFFFKQKTAYEMRISDWSSDVCSSDLSQTADPVMPSDDGRRTRCDADGYSGRPCTRSGGGTRARGALGERPPSLRGSQASGAGKIHPRSAPARNGAMAAARSVPGGQRARRRSEEHTSELQSLRRISYAV